MNRTRRVAFSRHQFASKRTVSPIALALTCTMFTSLAWGQLNPVPSPLDVSGKTISDWTLTGDQDSSQNPNPHLTRDWVGDGNTTDSLDYTASLLPFQDPTLPLPDVDALGNFEDLLFKRVVNDDATLLTSPGDLQFANPGLNEIYYRTDTADGALAGVWAKNFLDIGGADNPIGTDSPPEGIDGLEVWGGVPDHNMFSLYTDPDDPQTPNPDKISVFFHDSANNVAVPYIYNEDIRTAIGLVPGEPTIDLDGMMVFDASVSTGVFDAQFGPGDSLMFTVQENQSAGGPFHGGEIWVWDFGAPAAFLDHGGVIWDTANQPALLFGWFDPAGAPVNEINALEAIYEIPEPSAALLVMLGLAIGGAGRRRR